MGVFRRVGVLAIVFFIACLILTGCSGKPRTLEKSFEQVPITETRDVYADEQYTVQENQVVGEKCIERHYSELNNSRFNISIGEKEWLGEPIVGETNYVRRIVTVFNGLDEIDTIYLDKVYLYDKEETKRSKNPMKFLVDPKSTRKLYVMWNTQYDPLKDITIDLTNNTEQIGITTNIMRMCYNETEAINVTKTRKVVVGQEEEVVGYDNYVKVKLERK